MKNRKEYKFNYLIREFAFTYLEVPFYQEDKMEEKLTWEKRYEEIKKILAEYTPDFSPSEMENLKQLMEKAGELIKEASFIELLKNTEQEENEYRKFERLHPAF